MFLHSEQQMEQIHFLVKLQLLLHLQLNLKHLPNASVKPLNLFMEI